MSHDVMQQFAAISFNRDKFYLIQKKILKSTETIKDTRCTIVSQILGRMQPNNFMNRFATAHF